MGVVFVWATSLRQLGMILSFSRRRRHVSICLVRWPVELQVGCKVIQSFPVRNVFGCKVPFVKSPGFLKKTNGKFFRCSQNLHTIYMLEILPLILLSKIQKLKLVTFMNHFKTIFKCSKINLAIQEFTFN